MKRNIIGETPLERLLDSLRLLYRAQLAANRPHYVFTLTSDDETTLAFSFDELPAGLQTAMLLQGPRATFTQIYGVPIEWGASKTGVRELDATERAFAS